MSFLIARCGTSIPSRTVSSSAWTSRKAKRARTRPHLQHSPDTSLSQDLPLLPERQRPVPDGGAPLLALFAKVGHPPRLPSRGVIPKPRVFSSGARDLAWSGHRVDPIGYAHLKQHFAQRATTQAPQRRSKTVIESRADAHLAAALL